MYPLKIKPNRFFALGTTCVLSLMLLSIVLVIIASAQGDAPRAGGSAEVEAGPGPLQNGIVHIEPPVAVVENGETFRTHVMIHDAQDLGGFQFVINYNANVIEVVDPVMLGDFIGSTSRTILEIKNDVGTAGVITYAVATFGTSPGPNGDGVLASVDLRARNPGVSALDLQDVMIADTTPHTQTVSVGDGRVVVAIPPDPARVSITKSVEPPTVAPQGVLTYTLQRSFSLAGNHTYDEIVFDPIPSGTTCLPESVTLNGLPASQLYSATLDAILYRHNDVFTNTDQWTLTFQVQAGDVPSGTLIVNVMTETTRFDAAAYSGPYTGTQQALVLTPAPPPPWLCFPIIMKGY
jgi:uncharacterized repeat protein (TIGR01451 family)